MFQTQVCVTLWAPPLASFFPSALPQFIKMVSCALLRSMVPGHNFIPSVRLRTLGARNSLSVEMAPSAITQAGHKMAPWDHQAHGQPLLGSLLTLVAFLSCKWSIGTKSFLLCLVTVTFSLPSTSAHPHTQPSIHT